jgi:DNA-binding GntR family transcriptional regulator
MLTLPISPTPPRTKEEYAYETLRAAIMRCELKPGEKLVIDTLSLELNISPIPIRAALQRLHAEGLVEITPHTGAVVSLISSDLNAEIFILLEALESAAFRLVSEKATPADLAHLRKFVVAMEEACQGGDTERWSILNTEFHLAVSQLTDMKMIVDFTGRVFDSWNRLQHCYLPSIVSIRMPQAQAEHQQMLELLERRDTETLVTLVAQHNRQARVAYEQLLCSQRNEDDRSDQPYS